VLHPPLRRTHSGIGPSPPGLRSRARARVSGIALARELASGTPPWQSPRHAARALQLTGDSYRAALAHSLERLIALAEKPPRRRDPVPVCRRQVRDASGWLHVVAARLRDPTPVNPRGMAMITELLADGTSPCYARAAPGALSRTLQDAVRWLEVED
jgi:hypothetical protein